MLDARSPLRGEGLASGRRSGLVHLGVRIHPVPQRSREQPRRLRWLRAVARARRGGRRPLGVAIGAAHERQTERDLVTETRDQGRPDRLWRSRHPRDQRIDEGIGGGILIKRSNDEQAALKIQPPPTTSSSILGPDGAPAPPGIEGSGSPEKVGAG